MSQNLPQICTASAKANMKHTLKQMQYRFAVIYGLPCKFACACSYADFKSFDYITTLKADKKRPPFIRHLRVRVTF